jgi:hypothetical protein
MMPRYVVENEHEMNKIESTSRADSASRLPTDAVGAGRAGGGRIGKRGQAGRAWSAQRAGRRTRWGERAEGARRRR